MVLSCRLCLAKVPEDKLKNVFQYNIQHTGDTLVDVLFWVFSVEIDVTDPFSKDICSECIQLIEDILQVKNTFQKNQENLRNFSHNQNIASLDFQALDNENIEKDSKRQRTSSYHTTPTNSPSKLRYNSKNTYGSSSPRIRVSLSSMEAMCPMNVNLVQLENTQEFLRYRRLKNGSFKKRKYRHFRMDGALLDDICSTLEDKKCDKTEPSNKEVGVSTEYSLLSKGVNTDEKALCTYNESLALPLKVLTATAEKPTRNLLHTDKTKQETDGTLNDDDDFLGIISLTKNVSSSFMSPEDEREYDWTTLTFKKDACNNTECTLPINNTRNIGINATVHSTTTGTLTKRFRQTKDKNVVKINIDSLASFGPTVVLEPLEDIIETINYKEIDTFRYIKSDGLSSESKAEENIKENDIQSDLGDNPKYVEPSKKQKFLDYYKNFSSFAVRELIAGKKIRESHSSPMFKIANVCNVFVCDFCSKSFLSMMSLNLHYKRAHKSKSELNKVVVNLVNNKRTTKVWKKNISNINSSSGVSDTVDMDSTSEGHVETAGKHTKEMEDKGKNSSNNKTTCRLVHLRKPATNINYNLNDIIGFQTNAKQMAVHNKKRRQNKRLGNVKLVNQDKKNISYIWDRKRLGKYSAISYYKNSSIDKNDPPHLDLAHCDIQHKQDLALNETIQKLANRLDGSCPSENDMSDNIDVEK